MPAIAGPAEVDRHHTETKCLWYASGYGSGIGERVGIGLEDTYPSLPKSFDRVFGDDRVP